MNLMKIAAACARVAVAVGVIIPFSSPSMMPFSTAQCMAVAAQSLTVPASGAMSWVSAAGSPLKRQSIVTSCSRVTAPIGFVPSETPLATARS